LDDDFYRQALEWITVQESLGANEFELTLSDPQIKPEILDTNRYKEKL
jgi:hypothetical protein